MISWKLIGHEFEIKRKFYFYPRILYQPLWNFHVCVWRKCYSYAMMRTILLALNVFFHPRTISKHIFNEFSLEDFLQRFSFVIELMENVCESWVNKKIIVNRKTTEKKGKLANLGHNKFPQAFSCWRKLMISNIWSTLNIFEANCELKERKTTIKNNFIYVFWKLLSILSCWSE